MVVIRSKEEIEQYIEELKEGIENVRANKHKYIDQEVWRNMIRENQHRITTLEWVLGQHNRWD